MVGVLRIGSTSNLREHATWLAVVSSLLLLTRPNAYHVLSSGFQLARASGPLGWNDEEVYSVTVPNWKEKSVWLEWRMKSIRVMPTKLSRRKTLSFFRWTENPLNNKSHEIHAT